MSPPKGRKPRAARPTALEAPRTVAECLADLEAPAAEPADPIPGAGLPPLPSPAPRSGESTGRGALLCGWCHNRPDASHATCVARPEAFRCECACRRPVAPAEAYRTIPPDEIAARERGYSSTAEATERLETIPDLLACLGLEDA